MVFMGRSRGRPRGGAIQFSTRKEGGHSHVGHDEDRNSGHGPDSRAAYRNPRSSDNRRERSRSPVSSRQIPGSAGEQYPSQSASELAHQESLRITVGNDMFREHHSPSIQRFASTLADRLGPPVDTRSQMSYKAERYGESEFRGKPEDDERFYKQMDEEYRRSNRSEDIGRERASSRDSPSRSHRHDRDRDNDRRDRERLRESSGRRHDDRSKDRDRRRDDTRERDRDQRSRDNTHSRSSNERTTSRDSGRSHGDDRNRTLKERSPFETYPGEKKIVDSTPIPVMQPPPIQVPPKPLKSILKKSAPAEVKDASNINPQLSAGPYSGESMYSRRGGLEHPKPTSGLPGMSNYMDIEDEEKFLYGDDGHSESQAHSKSEFASKERYAGAPWLGQVTSAQSGAQHGSWIGQGIRDTRGQDGIGMGQLGVHQQPHLGSWMGQSSRDEGQVREIQHDTQPKMDLGELLLQQKLSQSSANFQPKTDMFSYNENTYAPQQQAQAYSAQPSVDKTPTTTVDLLSIFTNRSSSSFFQSQSTATSTYMEPKKPEVEKPKSANYDPTIENILKSIGFDFEMSKRMQEKGQTKPVKPKEDELQLGLNQNASFLEGGLADDVKSNLFKKDESVVESLIREAKESVSQITKVLASRETQATKFINEEAKYINQEKSPLAREKSTKSFREESRYSRSPPPSKEKSSKLYRDERRYSRSPSPMKRYSRSPSPVRNEKSYKDRSRYSRSPSSRHSRSPPSRYSRSPPSRYSRSPSPYNKSSKSYRDESKSVDVHVPSSNTLTNQNIPSTETSHYTSPSDPYNTRRSSVDAYPVPSQSASYTQPFDPRYATAQMPGHHVPPPMFMGGPPPPHYPYGPPMYPGQVPYGAPLPGPYPPFPRYPPPGMPYSSQAPTTMPVKQPPPPGNQASPPGTNPTSLPSPVTTKSSHSKTGNLISITTIENKKASTSEVDLKIQMQEQRVIRLEKKEPVKKDTKDPISTKQSGKKDSNSVVSSTASESNRTVLPPKSQQKSVKRPASEEKAKAQPLTDKQKQKLLREKESRQRRMQSLEEELKRLRKQQNEIMRKRRRQKDVQKDPILLQNSKLQEEIAIQISKLRKATEETSKVLKEAGATDDGPPKSKRSRSDEKPKKTEDERKPSQSKKQEVSDKDKKPQMSEKPEKLVRFEFFDPGGHWCRSCNVVTGNIFDLFNHLHGKKHQKSVNTYDRPWMAEKPKTEEKKTDNVKVVALKGAEFLMAANAFYCTLCKEFAGDDTCAEAHLKSDSHYKMYQKHIQDNPFYEQRYKLDKAAGFSLRKDEDMFEDDTNKNVKEKKPERKEQNSQKSKVSQKATKETDEKVDKSIKISEKFVDEVMDTGPNKAQSSVDHTKIKVNLKSGNKDKDEKDNNDGKTSPDHDDKGKISINISNKTGIKPAIGKMPGKRNPLLPPWTPVTKQQTQASVPIRKVEDKPAGLDTFLTVGDKSKPLPVMKESRTIFPAKKIVTAKDILEAFSGKSKDANLDVKDGVANSKEAKDSKVKETKDSVEDMKLLGIDSDISPLAIPIPPPPPSQNLSLPDSAADNKAKATSSAKDMYNVFYANDRKNDSAKICEKVTPASNSDGNKTVSAKPSVSDKPLLDSVSSEKDKTKNSSEEKLVSDQITTEFVSTAKASEPKAEEKMQKIVQDENEMKMSVVVEGEASVTGQIKDLTIEGEKTVSIEEIPIPNENKKEMTISLESIPIPDKNKIEETIPVKAISIPDESKMEVTVNSEKSIPDESKIEVTATSENSTPAENKMEVTVTSENSTLDENRMEVTVTSENSIPVESKIEVTATSENSTPIENKMEVTVTSENSTPIENKMEVTITSEILIPDESKIEVTSENQLNKIDTAQIVSDIEENNIIHTTIKSDVDNVVTDDTNKTENEEISRSGDVRITEGNELEKTEISEGIDTESNVQMFKEEITGEFVSEISGEVRNIEDTEQKNKLSNFGYIEKDDIVESDSDSGTVDYDVTEQEIDEVEDVVEEFKNVGEHAQGSSMESGKNVKMGKSLDSNAEGVQESAFPLHGVEDSEKIGEFSLQGDVSFANLDENGVLQGAILNVENLNAAQDDSGSIMEDEADSVNLQLQINVNSGSVSEDVDQVLQGDSVDELKYQVFLDDNESSEKCDSQQGDLGNFEGFEILKDDIESVEQGEGHQEVDRKIMDGETEDGEKFQIFQLNPEILCDINENSGFGSSDDLIFKLNKDDINEGFEMPSEMMEVGETNDPRPENIMDEDFEVIMNEIVNKYSSTTDSMNETLTEMSLVENVEDLSKKIEIGRLDDNSETALIDENSTMESKKVDVTLNESETAILQSLSQHEQEVIDKKPEVSQSNIVQSTQSEQETVESAQSVLVVLESAQSEKEAEESAQEVIDSEHSKQKILENAQFEQKVVESVQSEKEVVESIQSEKEVVESIQSEKEVVESVQPEQGVADVLHSASEENKTEIPSCEVEEGSQQEAVDKSDLFEEVSDTEEIEKESSSQLELDEISNEDEEEYFDEKTSAKLDVSDVSDDNSDAESSGSGVSMEMGSDFEVVDECVEDEEEEEET